MKLSEVAFNPAAYHRPDEIAELGLGQGDRIHAINVHPELTAQLRKRPEYMHDVKENLDALENRGYLKIPGHMGPFDITISYDREGDLVCDVVKVGTDEKCLSFSLASCDIQEGIEAYLKTVIAIKNGGVTLTANEYTREDIHMKTAHCMAAQLRAQEHSIIMDVITAKKLVAIQAFASMADFALNSPDNPHMAHLQLNGG